MMMSRQVSRFWTFNTLLVAFLDLFVAYFLLCGSTIAFFAGKFLGFFGFSFSTPYINGFFDSDFTNLLSDYPTDKISDVQFAVARKFPFDSIFFRIQNGHGNGLNLDRGGDGGFKELEGEEASCSSKSDARKVVINETDDSPAAVRFEKEKGYDDMKGKGAVNYRVRGSIRRRRKDSGKHSSSVSSSPTFITCVEDHKQPNAQLEASSKYEAETPTVVKSDDRFSQDDVSNESGNNNPNGPKERILIDDGDKDTRIVSLTQELEEERAARSALYVELDEERNASATAADEAMAMILRLQEEKASIEMELRQYKRMIDEKSAYDLEEMNILKEILLRREREKHFLEKEVEAYRQMVPLENDQDFNEDPDLILQEISMSIANRKNSGNEDFELSKQENIEKTIPIVGEAPNLEMKSADSLNGNKELYKQLAEKESLVHDVHMIDNEPKTSDELKRSKKRSMMDESDGSFLRRLDKEADSNRSSSEVAVGRLPPISSKSARRNSTSVLDSERIRIDTEVGLLRERLRIVQEGREKLNFSIDNREKESLQLQLLEDIARQLQEIRMLTEPRTARQASLPLPSSKSSTRKRRGRSVSSGAAKSS